MDTLAILERLVSFATVSRDPNRPLIDFVRVFLAGHGIESEIVEAEGGRKAISSRPSVRATGPASCAPAIPTWCRSMVSHGAAIRFSSGSLTAGLLGEARLT
jgi:acetylornithine deacetylase/succinyl-diaminopimelate desuccinylase-like protein